MMTEDSDKSVSKRSNISTTERLAFIESDVHYMKRDIAAIKAWVKWGVLAIGAVVIGAVVRFVLLGGLNIPGNL